jgi:hypothetical protein
METVAEDGKLLPLKLDPIFKIDYFIKYNIKI